MTNGGDRPVLRPGDLSTLERTYLGVLDTGMVSAQLAGDSSFRLDYVTAVCLALREDKPAAAYLVEEQTPEAGFLADLTLAARRLDELGVIALAPPEGALVGLEGVPTPPPTLIDFDARPRVADRYLAHTCLEELFGNTRVYPFLMAKYQDSNDVWTRLVRERPERFR